MLLLAFLPVSGYAEMVCSFGRDHEVLTNDITARSVRESRARRRDLAGFTVLVSKVLSEADR